MNDNLGFTPDAQGGQNNLGFTADAQTQPQQSPAEQIWGGLSKGISAIGAVTGANSIGESLGTAAYNVGQLAQGKNPFTGPNASESQVNIPKTIGGYAKAGATVLGAGLAPTSLAGTVGVGAGVGAAQGAGTALENNAPASEVVKQGAIGAGMGGVTAGAIYGLGHLIGAAGDKIMTSVIKPSKADIADGFSTQTLKDYNLGGSLNATLDKTQSAMSDLSKQLSDRLAGANTSVNLNDVVNQTVSELTDASKLKGFGANAKIASALDSLKNEVGIVAENGSLSVPDAQVVKQAAGNFGAWQYGKVDPESKASEMVYNTFYNKLKTAIEDASPAGVKDINQQLAKLIPVQNAVLRRLPVAERSGLISLNDMIGLVGSTFHPAALGPTVLNLISKSGAAGSLLSKLGPAASRLAVPAATAASIGSQAVQGSGTGQ